MTQREQESTGAQIKASCSPAIGEFLVDARRKAFYRNGKKSGNEESKYFVPSAAFL